MKLRIRAAIAKDLIVPSKPSTPTPSTPEKRTRTKRAPGSPKKRKPKWDPTIKHKKEEKVLLPDIQIRGIYHDLVADVVLDPVSGGYDAVVEIMGTKVRAWGLKIDSVKKELITKVRNLSEELGWDKAPTHESSSKGITIIFRIY